MKTQLAVLYGSRTCEHDVSIITGLQAAQNADPTKYDIIYVYITREGEWYTGQALADINFYRNFDPRMALHVVPMGVNGKLRLMQHPDDKVIPLGRLRVYAEADVALLALHGMNGEDGAIPGMLDLWNVPYTSSGLTGSSVGMDKIMMKQAFRGCGLPTLPDLWVDRRQWQEDRAGVMDRVEQALTYPVYVKPANLGSSIGISRAEDRNGLEEAIDVAVAYDRRILIEQGVTQLKEINCAVLGYADEVIPSMTEMPVSWHEFLSFDEKYLQGGKGGKNGKRYGAKGIGDEGMSALRRVMPAPIGDAWIDEVERLAVAAFQALDCKGVARIDFLLDEAAQKLYIGEINTIPGSLAFYLWEKKGISFPQLIDRLVEYAYQASAARQENVFSYQSPILDRTGGVKGGKIR